jgi:LPS sulfotransferase NodH
LAVTPRSGSTLLGEWLNSVGGLGQPDEYFNPKPDYPLEIWSARLRAFTTADYLDRLVRCRQSNGVFSLKVDLPRLLPFLGTDGALLTELSPNFVYLCRRDLVAQAVSLHRAAVEDRWNTGQKATREAEFDLTAIADWIQHLTGMMASWEAFFSVHRITPLRLIYEDMVADPAGTVDRVADFVAADCLDRSALSTRYARQSDALSREWAERVRNALSLNLQDATAQPAGPGVG